MVQVDGTLSRQRFLAGSVKPSCFLMSDVKIAVL
jgi:Zn ribbon nucleic-acid-binding protein